MPLPPGQDIVELDVYGNIYLLDRETDLLWLRNAATGEVRTLGGKGWGETEFDRPSGIWVENGIDIYVADEGNHRVQRFDRELNFVSTLHTRDDPDPRKRFGYPKGVALSRLGELFLLDGENVRVLKLNRANDVERSFGGVEAGAGRLRAPTGLVTGPRDRVYVADRGRVLVFDTFGNYLRELLTTNETDAIRIAADESGGIVLHGESVTAFDAEDRILRTGLSAAVLPQGAGRAVDVALHAGKLYFLVEGKLIVVDDPRRAAAQERE